MQFVKATALAAICLYLLSPSPAAAQSVPQQNAYVPIVLDAIKFSSLYIELRKIPMPADAHERIAVLLQNLEREAQVEKSRADATKQSP
jgi:hypothetical protein